MTTLLKKYDLAAVKTKFFIIYILNVTDILFTLYLLSSNMFVEVNIFMIPIVQNTGESILLKVIIPLILLYVLFKRMKLATTSQLLISNKIINVCLLFYIGINMFHVLWVTILLFSPTLLNI